MFLLYSFFSKCKEKKNTVNPTLILLQQKLNTNNLFSRKKISFIILLYGKIFWMNLFFQEEAYCFFIPI